MSGILEATFAEIVQRGVNSLAESIFTAEPGRVVAFNAENDTADVELSVRNFIRREDTKNVPEDLPILPSVPVLSWSSNTFINRFPISVGDPVLVIVCTRSIDVWFGSGQLSNAADSRRHALGNAVCIPGLKYASQTDTEADRDTDLILGRIGGGQIRVKENDEVHLGENNPSDFVALSNKVDTEIERIWQLLTTWTPVSSDGGAALKTAAAVIYPANVESVAAEKVKAK